MPFFSKIMISAVILLIIILSTAGILLQHHKERIVMLHESEVLPFIRKAAHKHALPEELLRAVVWKESRFRSNQVGSKGEIGLTQITQGAVADWARVNKRPVPNRRELFEPELNLEIGAWYLALCGQHWDGYASRDILQLAEYNAGRSKVTKDWAPPAPETIIELERITYPGTRSYIKQILERQNLYREKAKEANPSD